MSDDLARLLAVQDLDTSITQLQHRRAALAETSGLAAVEAELAALEAERAEVAARRGALTATQKDLEEQIAGITARRGSIEKRMYAATGSSARDLQAMNDEVRHLTERRAELEELELVAMLDQDPVDAELAALGERMAPLETRAGELGVQVAHEQAEIDAELASAAGARAAEAALLPAALAEPLRDPAVAPQGNRRGARLVGNHCGGLPPRAVLGRGREDPGPPPGRGRHLRAVRPHPRPHLTTVPPHADPGPPRRVGGQRAGTPARPDRFGADRERAGAGGGGAVVAGGPGGRGADEPAAPGP